MSKKTFLIILTLAFLIVVIVSGVVFAVSPEQQAKICAEENLPKYLEIIKPVYADFALSSEDQLNKAVLGEPIANFFIEPSKITSDKPFIEQMQQHAFYDFPVIVDGKSVMDFTVVLDNGQWKPVDIGGKLTKIINEVGVSNNFDQEQTKILRFAGQTFVLVNKDGKEVAYSPYTDYSEVGIKAEQIISESELETAMKTIYESYLKNSSSKDGEMVFGGTYKATPFKQDSVLKRLFNFCTHAIQG